MALKKSEKRLLGVLGIVVFIFVMDTFVCSKGDDSKTAKTPAAQSTRSIKNVTDRLTSKPAVQVAALPKKRFDSWGKDPFFVEASNHTSNVKKSQVKKPNIQGIFEKEGKTYVMVNDIVIEEGKEKNGIHIISIDGNRITYNLKGRRYTLVWGESL